MWQYLTLNNPLSRSLGESIMTELICESIS